MPEWYNQYLSSSPRGASVCLLDDGLVQRDTGSAFPFEHVLQQRQVISAVCREPTFIQP
jgi:hypothetical protein